MAYQSPAELDIIIVGAGIIGLAAAAALRTLGHKITLVEKSTFGQEVGFSITVGTNGSKVLASLGLDSARARAVDCNHVDFIDGVTLEPKSSLYTQEFAKSFWNDFSDGCSKTSQEFTRTFYRPDLHSELKRLALTSSPDSPTPELLLGSEVVAVDIENANVTLANGIILRGDLIIGADGERSVVKAAYRDPNHLRQAIFKMFRIIIPIEKIIEDETTRPLLSLTRNSFTMFSDETRTMSWFEGRGGTLQAIDIGYLVTNKDERKAETDPERARKVMLDEFKHYHPSLLKVLEKAEKVTDWEVNWSKPLPHLFKGKSVLIGDAAHSMLPSTGQGCCQGLEDVGALSILLSNLSDKSEITQRLEIMTSIRKDRETIVQYLSGIRLGQEEEFRKAYPSHWIHKTPIKTGRDHIKFLFDYDIFAESKKALERDQRPRALL